VIEAAKAIFWIVGTVVLFGKIIESNVDVDKNWADYLKEKAGKG